MSLEAVAQSFQLAPDFEMVIDFAIEDDDRIAIFGKDRLVAVGEIDNLQPGGAQGTALGTENSLLIRAAMNKRLSR